MSKSWIAAIVVIAAALAFAPPAGAGPKGKAGNRDRGKGVMATRDAGQIRLGAGTGRLNIGRNESAGDVVVRIIDDALGITNGGLGLPPGLAKRHTLPPGLAKRSGLPPGLAKGHGTPPGLAKRAQLPPGLRK